MQNYLIALSYQELTIARSVGKAFATAERPALTGDAYDVADRLFKLEQFSDYGRDAQLMFDETRQLFINTLEQAFLDERYRLEHGEVRPRR